MSCIAKSKTDKTFQIGGAVFFYRETSKGVRLFSSQGELIATYPDLGAARFAASLYADSEEYALVYGGAV